MLQRLENHHRIVDVFIRSIPVRDYVNPDTWIFCNSIYHRSFQSSLIQYFSIS